MKTQVYTTKGKPKGEIELSDAVFARPWNDDLVHQALVTQQANRRVNTAHAKDRSEVRGGGKKPWRQKGTGRARHGSTRSPIWAGGGVTHGPRKEKNYAKRINRKMVRAAINAVVSKRLAEGELKVVDSLTVESHKTKALLDIVKNFSEGIPSALLIAKGADENLSRATNNLEKVKSITVNAVNVEDLLRYKTVLFDKEAAEQLKA